VGEVWYPNAQRVAGRFSGYAAGRNRMEVVKLHYTVGRNSYPIGERGYFQWLIARDGRIWQFAPVDALNYDSGEWNDAGPGVEIEYHPDYDDAIFTPEARETAKGLVQWLHSEHGFPLVKWGGDRISEYAGFRGFIDHADLIQTEQHHDFWPESDWAYIAGDTNMGISLQDFAAIFTGVADKVAGKNLAGEYVRNVDLMSEILKLRDDVKRVVVPTVDVKSLAAEIARQLPPDGDADPRAIAEAVRAQFKSDPLR